MLQGRCYILLFYLKLFVVNEHFRNVDSLLTPHNTQPCTRVPMYLSFDYNNSAPTT
jgi:hypothetical protein